MADASGSISLTDLLIRLLNDHVPKEVAYREALYQHTKGSKRDKMEGDPPIWERTPWDTAVRWLAQRSAYFHGIGSDQESAIDSFKHPNAAFADPTRYGTAIEEYERRLREYLADVIQGGPNQSNRAAAELLEFERQGVAAELCNALGDDLPASIQEQLASAQPVLHSTSGLGSLVDEIRAMLYPDITDAILAAARTMHRPSEEPTGTTRKSKSNRRGRPKADYEAEKREAELFADWERARDTGTCKADFVKDHKGMTIRMLNTLLTRVRKRKSRAD